MIIKHIFRPRLIFKKLEKKKLEKENIEKKGVKKNKFNNYFSISFHIYLICLNFFYIKIK